MPIYEYKCQKCGDVFDVRQKFSEEPLKVHEGCGGEVERLISTSAFNFKGTGWYVTDYAKKKGSNGSSKSSEGGKSSDSTKSETKSSESSTTPTTPAKTTDSK